MAETLEHIVLALADDVLRLTALSGGEHPLRPPGTPRPTRSAPRLTLGPNLTLRFEAAHSVVSSIPRGLPLELCRVWSYSPKTNTWQRMKDPSLAALYVHGPKIIAATQSQRQSVFDRVACYTLAAHIGVSWTIKAEGRHPRVRPLVFADAVIVETPGGDISAAYSDEGMVNVRAPQSNLVRDGSSTRHCRGPVTAVSHRVVACADTINAFLHFSYIASRRRFVACLQRVDDVTYVVSQVAILPRSPDDTFTTAQGPANRAALGPVRCKEAVLSHRCGAACRELNLPPMIV